MKKRLFLVMILIVVLNRFVVAPIPAAAKANLVEKQKFEQIEAGLYYEIYESDCIVDGVEIFATEQKHQAAFGPWEVDRFVRVSVYRYNLCTETQLFFADGEKPVDKKEFKFHPNLNYATVEAKIPAYDMVSGQNVVVNVQIQWTGTGDISSYHNCQGNTLHSSRFRETDVSGIVSTASYTFPVDQAWSIESQIGTGRSIYGVGCK